MSARRGLVAALVCALGCAATADTGALEPADPDLIPEARRVLHYLESVYGRRTLTGISDWGGGPKRAQAVTAREPAIWAIGAFAPVQPKFGPAYHEAMQGKVDRCIRWWHERGGIVSMDFHWGKPGDPRGTAWVRRTGPFDVGKGTTPGTAEHRAVMEDLRRTADYLQRLAEAGVPVLWRPLHEIEGGWFWWTDVEEPENTAALWRLMFDYFVEERGIHNLIWVYSSAQGHGGVPRDGPVGQKYAYRSRFYPGNSYVDIAGVDIYVGLRMFREDPIPWAYETVQSVAPEKMAAMCECGALPNPELMRAERIPWLYCLAWFALDQRNPAAWMRQTYQHAHYLTLDELPSLAPHNVGPRVGISAPCSGATVEQSEVKLEGFAADCDGNLGEVGIYRLGGSWKNWFCGKGQELDEAVHGGEYLGRANVRRDGRWSFLWKHCRPGLSDLVAVARDTEGLTARSNVVRLAVGMQCLSRNAEITASSRADTAANAVDGDLFTIWFAGKREPQTLTMDLGSVRPVGGVIAAWWNAYAKDYRIQVSAEGDRWREVGRVEDNPNRRGDSDVFRFEPVGARYVRLHVAERGTDWGGLWLQELAVFDSIPP